MLPTASLTKSRGSLIIHQAVAFLAFRVAHSALVEVEDLPIAHTL